MHRMSHTAAENHFAAVQHARTADTVTECERCAKFHYLADCVTTQQGEVFCRACYQVESDPRQRVPSWHRYRYGY